MKIELSKFFRYALGETIIVMIGILLAVEIGNWNDTRKTREVEIEYLQGFKDDLMLDQQKMAELIEIKKQQNVSAEHLMNYFIDKPMKVDTFLKKCFQVTSWYDFESANNTYNELINSGNLNIISNDKIRRSIINLREKYLELETFHQHVKNDNEQYLHSAFSILDLKTLQIVHDSDGVSYENDPKTIRQVDQLMQSTPFKNGLHLFNYNYILIGKNMYASIHKLIDDLIKEIESEMKKG